MNSPRSTTRSRLGSRIRKFEPSLAVKFAAFSILVCLLATALCIIDLMHARSVAVGVARRAALNISRTLASEISSTFDAADLGLQTLAERVEHDGAGPAAQTHLHDAMAALLAVSPSTKQLLITNDRGDVVIAQSALSAGSPRSVAERPYFHFYQNHPGSGVFVDRSDAGESVAAATIAVVRRIDRRNGSFAGVAIATIDTRALNRAFEGVDVGNSGSLALVTSDGTVVAASPASAPDRRFLEIGGSGPYADFVAGSFVGASPIDGVRRLFAFQRLPRFPFTSVVGLTESEYLASWHADALANYAALAFGTALIGALASGLGGQIARRKRAESALAALPIDVLTGLASRRRFDSEFERAWREAAQDRLPLGLLMIHIGNLQVYNDRYGRQEGDELLVSIARAIANLVAPSDCAARYSGLELAVILPTTDATAARLAGERIRAAALELIARVTRARGAMVSVSIGAASLVPDSSSEPSVLIGAAFVALHNAENESTTSATLIPDALTGLASRRGFEAELEREWEHSAQAGTPLGLVVLDVSNLDNYNAVYGHEEGDELLIALARALASIVSADQLAARYSGLEFAALLPGTDAAATARLGERIALAAREVAAQRSGHANTGVSITVGAANRIAQSAQARSTLVGEAFIDLHRTRESQVGPN